MTQRIAWAKKNNVRPPEYALQQATSEGIDVSHWGITTTIPMKVILAKADNSLPSCCNKCCCSVKDPSQDREPEEQPTEVVVRYPKGISIWQTLACQGVVKQWLNGFCGPMPEIVEWSPECSWYHICETCEYSDDFYGDPPQPPPPRVYA